VEILDTDYDPADGVLVSAVRVNGTYVGTMATPPKVDMGDGDIRSMTVTLVLRPSSVEITGDDEPRTRNPIGFAVE
jgi:hypothetical protein